MKASPRVIGIVGCLIALTGSASASASTITLAWDPNSESDLAGYKVYYDTDSGPPYSGTQAQEGPSPIDVPLGSLADATMPSLALHGMPSCTTFFFAVTAYDTAALESAYSTEISATALATPTNVAATPSGQATLHLTWVDPPADDAGTIPKYLVEYDTHSGGPYNGTGATEGDSPIQVPSASLPDPANPSFDLTGLTVGKTYYLVVQAACDDGTTKTSMEVSAVAESDGTGGGAPTGAGGANGTGGAGGSSATTSPSGAGGANPMSGAGGSDGSSGGGASDNGGPHEGSGCGCRVAGAEGDEPGNLPIGALLAMGALAGWRSRSRRRDRRASNNGQDASCGAGGSRRIVRP